MEKHTVKGASIGDWILHDSYSDFTKLVLKYILEYESSSNSWDLLLSDCKESECKHKRDNLARACASLGYDILLLDYGIYNFMYLKIVTLGLVCMLSVSVLYIFCLPSKSNMLVLQQWLCSPRMNKTYRDFGTIVDSCSLL